jgi:uncharacterized alkaline shock family protein YloU
VKPIDRFLLVLYALLVAVFSVLLLLGVSGWAVIWDNLNSILLSLNSRIITGAVAGVLLLISLTVIFRSFQQKPPMQAIIRSTLLGEIRITLPALENLVVRAANQVKGVRDVKPKIKSTPEGVTIFLRVTVSPDIEIPTISIELQDTVKSYVKTTAGIEVLELGLLVENITRESHPRVE